MSLETDMCEQYGLPIIIPDGFEAVTVSKHRGCIGDKLRANRQSE